MTNEKYTALCNEYNRVTEAIALFDSGNHPEYDKETLDRELDNIHKEICEAVSELMTELVNIRAEANFDNLVHLNVLFRCAENCKDYQDGWNFLLENDYGNGYIDSIGADFYIIWDHHGAHSYGYREFFKVMEDLDFAFCD